MRELFEDLKIWRFENAGEQSSDANQSHKFEIMGRPEHLELAQFGRVLHDWRSRDKKKNSKQEDKR